MSKRTSQTLTNFDQYLESIYKKNFERGSSTYTCDICGKKTRDTGIGEKQVGLCKKCYEQNEKENEDGDNE